MTDTQRSNLITWIPVRELYSHPDNPRKDLGDLKELADSIKAKGIMQNLTVVARDSGGYTVIIGHRRTAAAKLAGLTELPCVITDMTPAEQVQTMLLENMQRSDLTVYEQAQGFQMMMDFGDTVESISEKTGFSKSTVRRRLKMAELDQNVLKSVSDRQISLFDFDRLSQIDDLEMRNKCLSEIGTANFNQTFAYQLKKQNIAKKLPRVKEEIKKLHARKIMRSETYGGKYISVGNTIRFYEWDTETPIVSSLPENDKLFYCIDEDYGTLAFYIERPKAKPQKRPQAEIEREKYISEVRTKLTELTADMYKLRRDFILSSVLTVKNHEAALKGAVIAGVLNVVSYVHTDSSSIYSLLGMDTSQYCADRASQAIDQIQSGDKRNYLKFIYTAFGDKEDNGYAGGYSKNYPAFQPNYKLDALYNFLISLGYEMSDEEQQLRSGTHELFTDKDSIQKNGYGR